MHRQQLEDVPELIQHIQSLLPATDATRTSVLSKSWLHAWSTIPTLRLGRYTKYFNKEQEEKHMRLIIRTLRRYHRDNLPIITCDLHFGIHNQKAAPRAEKMITQVVSKSSLKELYLTIMADDIASFTLPDEIFSSEKLDTLSLKLEQPQDCHSLPVGHESHTTNNYSLYISSNPVIQCVNLRVLELLDVHISEEVLHNLLSTCKLLEKINLKLPKGLEKIKVNNLRYLHELKMASINENDNLEISNVPSLHSFFYDLALAPWMPALSITKSIGSLRELYLNDVFMDDACSEMINFKFPFLESLTLNMSVCLMEILDIRCVSLRRLKIKLMEINQVKVQVHAPKLFFFSCECTTIPSFLFPSIAPEQIELIMMLDDHIDHTFFLKMRETLNLSSNFKIVIQSFGYTVLVPFNIDDVRKMVPFPATNVEKLSFVTFFNRGFWENSLVFDAFFSICDPMYVKTCYHLRLKVANYFLKLMAKGVMENNNGKVNCEIRNPLNGKWVTMTSSSSRFLDETDHVWYDCEFKLNWCSP